MGSRPTIVVVVSGPSTTPISCTHSRATCGSARELLHTIAPLECLSDRIGLGPEVDTATYILAGSQMDCLCATALRLATISQVVAFKRMHGDGSQWAHCTGEPLCGVVPPRDEDCVMSWEWVRFASTLCVHRHPAAIHVVSIIVVRAECRRMSMTCAGLST